MSRTTTRPGGRTTDQRRGRKTVDVKPSDAATIYNLGYLAGQRGMSADAKALRDEWWKGYATGLLDAYTPLPGDLTSPPAAGSIHPAENEAFAEIVAGEHQPAGHRFTLAARTDQAGRRRREHLRLTHGGEA
jgi:hypothetical protein